MSSSYKNLNIMSSIILDSGKFAISEGPFVKIIERETLDGKSIVRNIKNNNKSLLKSIPKVPEYKFVI